MVRRRGGSVESSGSSARLVAGALWFSRQLHASGLPSRLARVALCGWLAALAGCLQEIDTSPDSYACLTADTCRPPIGANDAAVDTAQADAQPETADPDAAQPDTAKPETTAADTAPADTTPPDAAPPDTAPAADAADAEPADAPADATTVQSDASVGAPGDATAAVDAGPVCAGSCDDGNPCTKDGCANGVCQHQPTTGGACNDGNACTVGDGCAEGACKPGAAKPDCDDKNPCTKDGCAEVTGCVHAAIDEVCDDGQACTAGDKCQAGKCTAGKWTCQCQKDTDCANTNPCTTAVCAGNACTYAPKAGPCDDKNQCTTGEACANGQCAGGKPVTCDDGKACTTDLCDPSKGCTATPYTCTDNNPCTADNCAGAGKCSFPPVADGAASCKGEMWRGHCFEVGTGSDQTLDTIKAACAQNKGWLASIHSADENEVVRQAAFKGCGTKLEAVMGLVQSSANDNTKHAWLDGTPYSYLNWAAGEPSLADEQQTRIHKVDGKWNDATLAAGTTCWVCERIPGTACDDKNPCTVNDACFAGDCTGAPQTCDDGIACTADQCTAASGCSSTAGKMGSQYAPLACNPIIQSKQCTATGKCEPQPAACTGKQCGFDGALGDCGKCALANVCTGAGQCAPKANYAQTDKVLVSGGAFHMGCTAWNDTFCQADTLPRHIAYVSSFYLDTYEASQSTYKACVAAGKCTVPGGGGYHATDDSLPMVKLTWAQASAYCTWAGGDLPTEAQWELAARLTDKGVNSAMFPWGNNGPPPGLSSIGNTGIAALADPYPEAHDAQLCYEKNALGVCNMTGNVSEWTRDWYASAYPTNLPVKDPVHSIPGPFRAVRGMSWFYSLLSEASPGRRFSYDPNVGYASIGVRCAYVFNP
ncbi:MAG: SUMF1/EgtB/PvdO family nonheme iron enzyme [Deltaproteobacteria bacterium]|nr:SUMF1/EgtB/PvdO family nonheme iron enzyme [Deltaproteobacteria bacterium]